MYSPDYIWRKCIKKLKDIIEIIKNQEIEIIEEREGFYRYKINKIDYTEANILNNRLLNRLDVKISTYTKKHLLDDYFEFKLEMKTKERISLLKIKEDEFNKILEIIDSL